MHDVLLQPVPAVSVCIPVYNTSRYLPECLTSILGQSFRDFEVVALDDGSRDASPEVLRDFAARDPRIRVHTRENRGVVATRNELLAMARADLIAWLDSDDIATPDRLALQVARFAREPELVCLGGACVLTDPSGLPIRHHAFPQTHEELVKAMEEEIAFYFPSVMMRRAAALRVGGFREPFRISEDFDMCLRLSEIGRVANLPDVILYYRQHLGSTVNAARPHSYTYSRLVRELAKERRTRGTDRLQRGEPVSVDLSSEPSPRQVRLETHLRWAWWALHDGHLQTARKYAMRALGSAPWSAESWRVAFCALRGR